MYCDSSAAPQSKAIPPHIEKYIDERTQVTPLPEGEDEEDEDEQADSIMRQVLDEVELEKKNGSLELDE